MIESTLPAVAAACGADAVALLAGEPPDATWKARIRASLREIPCRWIAHPGLGYGPGDPSATEAVAAALKGAPEGGAALWAHNLSLARNPLVGRILAAVCLRAEIPLLAHQHDWWFDGRWSRWPELRAAGARTLRAGVHAAMASGTRALNACINLADTRRVEAALPGRAAWVPNTVPALAPPSRAEIAEARRWFLSRAGGPAWLAPVRVVRRKNLAEALLLQRWLMPEAALVVTLGASSPEEIPYAKALAAAARRGGWHLHLGLAERDRVGAPRIAALMAAAACVVSSSIREGFGLPYLEAAAARVPLIARRLPRVFPDLDRIGAHMPTAYDDLLVPADLFDLRAERARQRQRFAVWKRSIPPAARRWAEPPEIRADGVATFSRLTLRAQIEVLSAPPECSWAACAPLNAFLAPWREAFRCRTVPPAALEPRKRAPLSAETFGTTVADLFRRARNLPELATPEPEALDAFVRTRLGRDEAFPLLWDPAP